MLEALQLVHALYDPVRPQMHNQMKLMRGLLERRWKNGSVDVERLLQGFTKFKPSKEGQGWKEKKELLLRRALAYLAVLQLRFHVFEADTYLAHSYGADGVTIDRDRYLEQFRKMVEASNKDEELADMNHEIFDVVLPFLLEKCMTRHAITEVIPMAAAWYLPWAQETRCPKIFRHFVEQLHVDTARSAERNAYVLHNAAPSMTGTPGTGQETDTLQELAVNVTQRYRLKKKGAHAEADRLLSRINAIAANLDIPLELIKHIEEEWAGMSQQKRRARGLRRTEAVQQLTLIYLLHFGVVDPCRRIDSGEPGAVARWELSVKLLLRPASPRLLAAKVFYCTDLKGGPLKLLVPAELLELAGEGEGGADGDGEGSGDDEGGGSSLPRMSIEPRGKTIVFEAQLVGVCLNFREEGMKGGNRYRVSKGGVAAGELTIPHRQARLLEFSPMPGLTAAALSGLAFQTLSSDEAGASMTQYIRVIWTTAAAMASRSAAAAEEVRSLLPSRLIILSIARTPMVKINPPDRARVLLGALKEGGEIAVSDAVSLQDAVKQAHAAAYPVLLSGARASRTPSGLRRWSKEAFRGTTAEQRRCVHGVPKAPPAAEGREQKLKLFFFKKSIAADAPQGGARRVKAAKTSGLQQANELATSKQMAAVLRPETGVTPEMLAAQQAEEARHKSLVEQTRAVHLVSATAQAGGVKLAGGKNTTDRGERPASQRTYRQPHQRLSSLDPRLVGGDNTKLGFYKNLERDARREHPHQTRALNMMHRAHTQGDAFDFSSLVQRPATAAAPAAVKTRRAKPPRPSSMAEEDKRRTDLEGALQAKLREIEAHDSIVIGAQDGETAGSVANSMPTLLGHQEQRRRLEREVEELRAKLDGAIHGDGSGSTAGTSSEGPSSSSQPTHPTQPTQQPAAADLDSSSEDELQPSSDPGDSDTSSEDEHNEAGDDGALGNEDSTDDSEDEDALAGEEVDF